MQMKKQILFISICLIALAKYSLAQEQPSIKQQADKLFERYEYFKSLNLYLEIIDKNNIQVTERIADCYREMNRYEDAEQWYAKAIDEPNANNIDHYYYAEVLLRNQKFTEAKAQYKIYFANDLALLTLKLSNCDSAALWMKQPALYAIKNASNLNTPYSDWGLTYDGKDGFVFTSDRVTDDEKTDQRTGNNWFKLYQANANGGEIKELVLSNQTKQDLDKYHVGPIALNAGGDTAYITITTNMPAKKIELDKSKQRLYTRRLQLVMARKVDGQWLVFGGFAYNDIQKYSIGNAALSKDGRVIYFSSDMPGGEGKTDIWYCEKQTDGSWGKPVNCGKTINTKDEDSFPFMDDNGTLYYSSKGLTGMGGYDIYSAKGEKANWSTPQNLKYPINTTSDDFYLVTRDGKSGYFSSNRNGGQGSDDIYSFDTVPSKPVIVKTPVNPPQFKQGFVLNTIYYDLDKSNIRPDAAVELDKLVALMNQNPSLKINIASYTDSRASYDYNLALSQRRAQAAIDYLVTKGIAADRLSAKWYGKNNLVNNCADGENCTEAEHQLNRRTEFSVQ
jgi:outer membrane protein OmpA-like peptidoglycan-associated protein